MELMHVAIALLTLFVTVSLFGVRQLSQMRSEVMVELELLHKAMAAMTERLATVEAEATMFRTSHDRRDDERFASLDHRVNRLEERRRHEQ